MNFRKLAPSFVVLGAALALNTAVYAADTGSNTASTSASSAGMAPPANSMNSAGAPTVNNTEMSAPASESTNSTTGTTGTEDKGEMKGEAKGDATGEDKHNIGGCESYTTKKDCKKHSHHHSKPRCKWEHNACHMHK